MTTTERSDVTGAPDTVSSSVIPFSGDLDAATVASFRRLIMQNPGAEPLYVDLQDLGFSDSAGLNALVRTHYDLARQGREFVLVNVPERLLRLLQLSGLNEIFRIRVDSLPLSLGGDGLGYR